MDVRDELKPAVLRKLLNAARSIMRRAKRHILSRQEGSVESAYKTDGTIVTQIDIETESLIKIYARKHFPTHDFVGEESQALETHADFTWFVDPIDGTHNFAHGIPTYGSMLGITYKNRPVVGVVWHPALKLEYYAAYRMGTYCNGRKVVIKDLGSYDPQDIIITHLGRSYEKSGTRSAYDKLCKIHSHIRMYYDTFAETRTIEGQAAAFFNADLAPWESPSTEILITEADGTFYDVPTTVKGRHPVLMGKKSMVAWMRKELGL